MTNKALLRWLWVVVATLAVAPVLAQTPRPVWMSTIPGPAAVALPHDTRAPGAASSVEAPAETREGADSLPAQTPPTLSTGSATAAQGIKIDEVTKRTTKKAAAKYDVTQIGSRPVDKGVNFYSLEREQRLGRELAAELEQQMRILDDPVVTEYVNRVGQNLVRNSDAKVPFAIRVVDEINAFALPGGYFYVNSGLIRAADNEAELAGVMAHEIAHVAARHVTKNLTKGQIWNMVSLPLIFVGGGAGYAIRQVVAVGVPMSFLKFSRDAEREADLLGLEYEYAAGYDPTAFVQFFEKIHAREKQEKHRLLSKLFSTHPMTDDRIRRAQEEMATMLPARDQYVVTTSEFDEVKSRLRAVTIRMKTETDERNANRPTLRRRTPQSGDPGNGGSSGTQSDGDDHDDHSPTLKRGSD